MSYVFTKRPYCNVTIMFIICIFLLNFFKNVYISIAFFTFLCSFVNTDFKK